MSQKVILSLCDRTGNWPFFYGVNGYRVITVDLQPPPEARPGREHVIADVRLFEPPPVEVYGILAAPPCTKFARSGARWWAEMTETELLEAKSIADACMSVILTYRARGCLQFWALENPIGRLKKWYGDPRMYFNPCDYGDPYTKRTCLWGEFNAPAPNPVEPTEGSKMHTLRNTPDRANIRSETPLGFAFSFYARNQ
jgi:hypothetical protein